MDQAKGLTWSQIRYWALSISLTIAGLVATIWGDTVHSAVKELGPGLFTAGILACLVEPFFRKEFARDAFLAAFRYVLPNEFREEIAKILRFDFIAEKQVWTIHLEKTNNDDVVFVTTTVQKTIRNKTKSTKPLKGLYQIPDFRFPNGSSKIVECTIQSEDGKDIQTSKEPVNTEHSAEAETDTLAVSPDKAAKTFAKAIQYRRKNDVLFETFLTPVINPEIEVILPTDFEHHITFGTHGDVEKSKYQNRYTLSGVYFPGQYMYVRWWPKAEKP
jgi:hypothetical protein